MALKKIQKREHWASKFGFVLAATGSAVGLGNMWRFPYKAGEFGGGAFVLVYLAAVVAMGIPVLIAEFIIGRSTQKNPVGAFKALRNNKFWPLVGWLGVLTGFVILSYYCVVGGWILKYIFSSLTSTFQTGSAVGRFENFLASPAEMILWHGIFMGLTIYIVRGGISSGIEKWSKILMPAFIILLFILMVNSLFSPGAEKGISFLLKPDFSKLTREGILEALGSAFFSLSLGMGAMLTYGSYLDKDTNISVSSLEIAFLDTFCAIIAGLMIFPIVFTYNMDPQAGPGLFFITLPEVFASMPAGRLIGITFFVLVAFAAITSAISLLEVVVSFIMDEFGWTRRKADYLLGFIIFLAGIPSALSFNIWSEFTAWGGKNIFEILDSLASNFMLPVGGFFIAIFAGWVLTHGEKEAEIKKAENAFHFYDIWHVLIQYVTPVALLIVLLYTTGVLSFFK